MIPTLLLNTGCPRPADEPRRDAPTAKVVRRTITQSSREDGKLMPLRLSEVVAEVDNERLLEIAVKEGATVRKGDLLARFDTKRIDREIGLIQARVEALKLQLELARRRRAGIEHIQASQLMLKAETEGREAARLLAAGRQLGQAGLATTGEVEKIAAQVKANDLELALAKQQLDELAQFPKSGEIAEIEVRLAESERQFDEARQARDKFTLTAAFDGRIMLISDLIKNINTPLDSINYRFSAGAGPLMILADTSSMRVIGYFYENDIAGIHPGQKARVTAKHAAGKVFEGEVVSVGQVGRAHGRTATVAVEVVVPNPGNALRQGLTAQIAIEIATRRDVLALPVEFLRYEGDKCFVVRIESGGRKKAVPVTTGIGDTEFIEIVSGLAEQDVATAE